MLGADDASRDAAFGALAAYPGGLQLGGGVTTDNAQQFLDAGASHVIVTSFVFRDGRLEEGRLADLVRGEARRGGGVRWVRLQETRLCGSGGAQAGMPDCTASSFAGLRCHRRACR